MRQFIEPLQPRRLLSAPPRDPSLDLRVLPDGRIAFAIGNVIGRLLPSGELDPSLNPAGPRPGLQTVAPPAGAHADVTATGTSPDGGYVFAARGTDPPPD